MFRWMVGSCQQHAATFICMGASNLLVVLVTDNLGAITDVWSRGDKYPKSVFAIAFSSQPAPWNQGTLRQHNAAYILLILSWFQATKNSVYR